MSYARIQRGPMAADVIQSHFVQISNHLFRDRCLSHKAKGIFAHIATHRDGYGVSAERLAEGSTDGLAAIRTGLRELEEHGYLVREQERNPDGTRGAMVYRITDMPSSQPECDFPQADEPYAADRTTKKINSKKTSQKKTSPSCPPQRVAGPAGGGGGGGEAPPDGEELRRAVEFVDGLPFGGRRPGLKARGVLVRGVVAAFAAGWPAPALRRQLAEETSGVRSLAAVYEHRLRPEQLPEAPAAPARRPRVAEVFAPDGPVSGPNAEWRRGRAEVRGRRVRA